MQAITVIETDDGEVLVIASGSPTFEQGVELLHKAVLDITKTEMGD